MPAVLICDTNNNVRLVLRDVNILNACEYIRGICAIVLSLTDLSLIPKIKWYKNFEKIWQPGENGAFIALDKFLAKGLKGYKELRNRADLEYSSKLSQSSNSEL
jgi:deoxyribodipyrimidine photolyase